MSSMIRKSGVKLLSKIIVLILCTVNIIIVNSYAAEVTYNEEERKYIDEHPVVSIGIDPEFSPYEFIDSDELYKGIAADYLKLLEIKTDLTFEIEENLTWEETYEKAMSGEIDMLPCVGITKQREKIFLFSDSYLKYQRAILSRDDDKVYKISDLENSRVGVQKNSSHYSYIISETNIEPIAYKTLEEVLLALSHKEIDVAIVNYAAARYSIRQGQITNIKADGILDGNISELAMAITNDNAILLGIINKGLSQITKEEEIEIQNKWLGIEKSADYSKIKRNVIIGAIIFLILLAIIGYWSYTLKKEVERRKIVEEELVAAKKEADKANEAKSTFLAHMSHEIRTPLNAITGLTYLLENTSTSTIQNKYINSLKDASYNLLNTINDILDFSKIEAGEIDVEEINFNVDTLLDKVSKLLMPKAREKGLAFHVKKHRNVKDDLIGDPNRIEQVLINLINNAIKFTQEGEICIEVSAVSVSEEQCVLKFLVSDTGIGISEEQLNNLFIPFHQLDSSVSRKYGGTGLGLTISKQLVTILGGTIDVTSTKDEGSTFYFILPFKIQKHKVKRTIASHSELKEIKLLVVDDDDVDREILGEYLENFDIKRILCSSIAEANEWLSKDIDLLVIDTVVNNESSYDFIKKATNLGIQVIVATKQIVESEYNILESFGVKHLLLKPIISSILFDSIVQSCSNVIMDIYEDSVNKDSAYLGNKILLVEDNEVNQIIEKEILEQRGFEVTLANNGLEAVESIENGNKYEVILMDIHMPIMNGYEATQQILKITDTIPIIAMTAVSFSDEKEKCEKLGMKGYVTKPVDPELLFATISQIIDNDVTVVDRQEDSSNFEKRCEKCDKYNYLDVKQGLKRIGNNEKLYLEILERYYEDIEEAKNVASQMIKNNENDKAHKLLHKIKGTSGNVGAVRLFQSTKTLMDAIDSKLELEVSPYLWEFESDLVQTLKAIKCINEEMEEKLDKYGSDVVTNTEEVKDLISELEKLLKNSDLDAFKVFEKLPADFIANMSIWQEIEQNMKKYDFAKAHELLCETK